MKNRIFVKIVPALVLIMAAAMLLCACIPAQHVTELTTSPVTGELSSPDTNSKNTVIDFYALNDSHGNVTGNNYGAGISCIASYLRRETAANKNTVLLSSGDMWQGSSESNNTKGKLMTEWLNSLGFVSMTLGNHEFDWSSSAIAENRKIADFPFLALNIYDKKTNKLASYCTPSVIVERDGVRIGIIGAVGNVYSSISSGMVTDVEFVTGSELTALVMAESDKLRAAGADIIVYSIHDGYTKGTYSAGSAVPTISDANLASYYDVKLSQGYVDLVFEGHQHKTYVYIDKYGVYHLQAGGYNQSIVHVTLNYDSKATKKVTVETAELVATSGFTSLGTDSETEKLIKKYAAEIGDVYAKIGTNQVRRDSDTLRQLVADLYLEAGLEKWGAKYTVMLAGGYLSCRAPGVLEAGDVCYADIQSLFPFDNKIVLCSVSGLSLLNNFYNTTNANYFISLSDTGRAQKGSINPNQTYYIISDTYSSDYAANKLTVVDTLDDSVYARDLIAGYVRAGNYAGTSAQTSSVASALALGDNTACTVSAQVAAASANGFLLRDNTGIIFVYTGGTTQGIAVGDTVKVSGSLSTYYNARQISGSPTVEVVSHGAFTQPGAVLQSAAQIDAKSALTSSVVPEYVRITGKLTVSGKYYNVAVDGASCVVSVLPPLGTDISSLNGKTITVEGYFLYVNGTSTRYYTILATSVVASSSATLAIDFSPLYLMCGTKPRV